MVYRILVLSAFLLLSGCAVVPDSLEVPDENQLINYQQAASDTQASQGKIARWGGVIAKIENLPDATMVELVYYPLRAYGRPLVSDESMGRFRVYVDGFLDPMVYEQGRSMTFTGEFSGVEEGVVGDHKYVFPTLKSTGYHLWKEIDYIEMNSVYIWPYDVFWGWPYRPYHQRVIIRGGGHRSVSGGSGPQVSQPTPRPPKQPSQGTNIER